MTSPSLISYIAGFALSSALTLFAFLKAPYLGHAAILIVALALVQLIVQLIFFLHLGRGEDASSRTWLFGFSFVITCILIGGTLWIMHNLARLHIGETDMMDMYQGGVVAPQNELR